MSELQAIPQTNAQQSVEHSGFLYNVFMVIGCVGLYVVNGIVGLLVQRWGAPFANEMGYQFIPGIGEMEGLYISVGILSSFIMMGSGFIANKARKYWGVLTSGFVFGIIGLSLFIVSGSTSDLKLGYTLMEIGTAISAPMIWFLIFNSLPFRSAAATTLSLPLVIRGFFSILVPYLITMGPHRSFSSDSGNIGFFQYRFELVLFFYVFLVLAGLVVTGWVYRRLSTVTPIPSQFGFPSYKWMLAFLILHTGVWWLNLVSPALDNIDIRSYASLLQGELILSPAFLLLGGVIADVLYWFVRRNWRSELGYLLMFLPFLLLYLFLRPSFAFDDGSIVYFHLIISVSGDLLTAAMIVSMAHYFPREDLPLWFGIVLGAKNLMWFVLASNSNLWISYTQAFLSFGILLVILWKEYGRRRQANGGEASESFSQG